MRKKELQDVQKFQFMEKKLKTSLSGAKYKLKVQVFLKGSYAGFSPKTRYWLPLIISVPEKCAVMSVSAETLSSAFIFICSAQFVVSSDVSGHKRFWRIAEPKVLVVNNLRVRLNKYPGCLILEWFVHTDCQTLHNLPLKTLASTVETSNNITDFTFFDFICS